MIRVHQAERATSMVSQGSWPEGLHGEESITRGHMEAWVVCLVPSRSHGCDMTGHPNGAG